jgi:hypothetical protein
MAEHVTATELSAACESAAAKSTAAKVAAATEVTAAAEATMASTKSATAAMATAATASGEGVSLDRGHADGDDRENNCYFAQHRNSPCTDAHASSVFRPATPARVLSDHHCI